MPHYICATCGVQFAESLQPPGHCPVCEDERQYVGWDGQRWTDLEQLQADHRNVLRGQGPGLTGIGTVPAFAIGQRALHVRSAGTCVLWDCVSLVDEASVAAMQTLGRVSAIAVSHPHYYSSIVEWSRALGGVPVYLHADDRSWVMRPDPALVFWDGETRVLGNGLTLVRCGGHFPGGTVLHRAPSAGTPGALFTGDVIQVVQDRRSVSFMYSFPNYIPLPAHAVHRIAAAVEPFDFDQIHGAWWDRHVAGGGKEAMRRSVGRYLRAIGDGLPPAMPSAP